MSSDYRSVQTRMWREDEWFQELDVHARLFWIYLFTNPSASPAGIYRLPLRTMAFESGIDSQLVQKFMRDFSAVNKAHYSDGVVWVVNMRRLQFPALTDGSGLWQIATKIASDIDAIPSCELKTRYIMHSGYPKVIATAIKTDNGKERLERVVSIDYQYGVDTLSIPYRYPIDTLSTEYQYPIDIHNITKQNITKPNETDIALSAPLAAETETSQNGKAHEPLPVETIKTPKPVKAKTPKPLPVEEVQPTGQQEMFGAICLIIYGHSTYSILTGKQKALLGTEASSLLKIGATPELVAVWYKEKWRSVWPGKNGTAPSFEQVRNGVAAYIESFTLPSVVDTVLSFDLEDVINA